MARALIGGNIHTMQTPGDRATAILWEDDTIVAVGDDETIRSQAEAQGIPVTDLEGRAVVPGFVDCHMHFLHVGIKRTRPDLRGASSKQEALDRVRAFLEQHPGEGPVTGEGWDEADWSGDAPFTRQELDAISPDRALVLRRICGHKAVANSQALPFIQERFQKGIDPETGVLLEEPSLYLNEALPADAATLKTAVQVACQVAHRLGVTAIGDYEQAPLRQALIDAAATGDLGVRVACSIYVQQLGSALEEGFHTGRIHPGPDGPSPFLRDGGLKVFLDGSLGGHTAHMRAPYVGMETRGLANWTDDEVRHWFTTAHDAGVQVHAHAIGDAAIDQGLMVYVELATGEGRPRAASGDGTWPSFASARHRFEHYEIAHDEHVEVCRRLGIIAACQPNFVGAWSAKGGMYESRIGEVFRLNNRYATFTRHGLSYAFSSDGMPFGPLYGLAAAIHHPVEEERLSPEDAVYRYTLAAAQAMHWDTEIGSLEEGKKADLLILDRPALDDAPKDWILEEVIVAGKTVCRNDQVFVSDDDVTWDHLTV